MNLIFFINGILLGLGLAMDAFSISLANGLNEPKMTFTKMSIISGCYAFFQFLMPMIGWVCVHTVLFYFSSLQKIVPWIALVLLLYIGGKMLIEAFTEKESSEKNVTFLTYKILVIQGIATSIDALSVGFTISDYNLIKAIITSIEIAIVTFLLCVLALFLGRKVGTKLAGKAGILGGIILIFIGIEIFIKGVFLS